MKRFSILHPLIYAFFSRALYAEVAQRWRGLALGYLLLLLLVTWLAWTLLLFGAGRLFTNQLAPGLYRQVPDIHIRDGRAIVDAEQPVMISLDGRDVAILDTTGQVTSLQGSKALLLLTETEFHTADGSASLPVRNNYRITSTTLQRWTDYFTGWRFVFLVVFPLALALSFVYRLLQVLLYGAIGLLFCRLTGTRLDYLACVRLAVIAITPSMLITTAVCCLPGLLGGYWLLASFAISMGYLYFAVQSAGGDGGEDGQDSLVADAMETETYPWQR